MYLLYPNSLYLDPKEIKILISSNHLRCIVNSLTRVADCGISLIFSSMLARASIVLPAILLYTESMIQPKFWRFL
jgi:hypothetical protein